VAVSEQRRRNAELNYKRILAERLAAATAEAVSRGPNSRRQRDLDARLVAAQEEFLATQAQLDNRAPDIKIKSPIVFWATALVIFLCEAMFNRVVVEMAVPVPSWLAFTISAIVSGILMAFAHIAGAQLRQLWSELRRSVYVTNVLLGVFLLAVDVAGILAIIALRGYFATADIAGEIDIFQSAGTLLKFDPAVLTRAFSNPEAITLGGINALALFLAFIVGMLSHDSEREYHARYVTFEQLSAKSDRDVSRYEGRQEKVFAAHRHHLSRASRAYVGNGGAIEDLPKDDFKGQRAEAEGTPGSAPAGRNVTSLSGRGTAA
jgi:hypothetical protein